MTLEYEEVLFPNGGLLHYGTILSTERCTSELLEDVSLTVDLNSSKGLSSLSITGRYRASAPSVTVRVRGKAGKAEREFIYHFDLDQTSGHHFVPRLWATRRIRQLLDRVRVEGESDALVEEIRTTGLGYGLGHAVYYVRHYSQFDGAASQTNMDLYGNLAELNQLSGETTVQARVQNQSYQQAEQASMATGANVIDIGQNSLVQAASQNPDLSLLQEVNLPGHRAGHPGS